MLSMTALASSTVYQTNRYAEIKKIYDTRLAHYSDTLLVFDIDDTLLTSTSPLASTAFWEWQAGLIKQDSHSQDRLAKDIAHLLNIEAKLFSNDPFVVTDEELGPFIKHAVVQGAHTLLLTARSPEFEPQTNRHLDKPQFILGANQGLFKKKGISFNNHQSSSRGNFHCSGLSRPVAYDKGVMYVTGQNKGKSLNCLLRHSKKQYRHILFVDDTYKNIKDMSAYYQGKKGYTVVSVWFTKENAKEFNFLHSVSKQHKALMAWQGLERKHHSS